MNAKSFVATIFLTVIPKTNVVTTIESRNDANKIPKCLV